MRFLNAHATPVVHPRALFVAHVDIEPIKQKDFFQKKNQEYSSRSMITVDTKSAVFFC